MNAYGVRITCTDSTGPCIDWNGTQGTINGLELVGSSSTTGGIGLRINNSVFTYNDGRIWNFQTCIDLDSVNSVEFRNVIIDPCTFPVNANPGAGESVNDVFFYGGRIQPTGTVGTPGIGITADGDTGTVRGWGFYGTNFTGRSNVTTLLDLDNVDYFIFSKTRMETQGADYHAQINDSTKVEFNVPQIADNSTNGFDITDSSVLFVAATFSAIPLTITHSGDIPVVCIECDISALTNTPTPFVNLTSAAGDFQINLSTGEQIVINATTARALQVNAGTVDNVAGFASGDSLGIIQISDSVDDYYFGGQSAVAFFGTATNASSPLNVTLNSTGQVGIGAARNGRLSISDATEAVGSLNYQIAREVHTLAAASTSDTSFDIPSGALLKACSFNVDDTISDDAGDDTWSAAFTGGSSTALASGAAATINTKVNTNIVPEVASATTNIRFTANGGNFDGGIIEVQCYYEDLTSLDDAA